MIDTIWGLLRDHLASWKNNTCVSALYEAFGYTAPEMMVWKVYNKYGAVKEGNKLKFMISAVCSVTLTENTLKMKDGTSAILITRTNDGFTIV